MRYQISGKQIDIGEALQTHVKTELTETLSKYAGRPTEATVTFSKSGTNSFAKPLCISPPASTLRRQARATKSMVLSMPAPQRWTSSFAATRGASRTITGTVHNLLNFQRLDHISSNQETSTMRAIRTPSTR